MAAETGWRWSKCEPAEGLGNEGQACANINPIKLLEAFTVKKEYTDKLGQEEFLIKNLLIKQHILVVVAMPGGGKTAFFFRHVAPTLAGKGLKVFYMDCDSPASDHRAMRELAEHHGFSFLNPDANQGTSIELLKKTLQQIADADTDLNGWVFIFDTLKKFADLMQKNAVKEFFKMCRRLTGRGASVVLLAHSNKHRSTEGFLVPEGVGDVRNDADDLIIFERSKNANGGIDVTTVVDTDRNAKVRGIFQPFSFHVSPERKISFYKFPLTITDPTQTAATKATDDEIMDAATRALEDMAGEVTQQALVSRVCDMTGAGNKRVRELIVQNAERGDASEKRGLRFWYVIGEHNRFMYRLPDIPPEQVTIFDSNQFGKHDLGFTN
jgi:KaiC/GvpD/RAD55 family RecA-like ATPase